jgi:hypothetical protein
MFHLLQFPKIHSLENEVLKKQYKLNIIKKARVEALSGNIAFK